MFFTPNTNCSLLRDITFQAQGPGSTSESNVGNYSEILMARRMAVIGMILFGVMPPNIIGAPDDSVMSLCDADRFYVNTNIMSLHTRFFR